MLKIKAQKRWRKGLVTKQEYDAIFDMLRKKVIVIPPECLIIRFRDVVGAMDCYVEPRKIKEETDENNL